MQIRPNCIVVPAGLDPNADTTIDAGKVFHVVAVDVDAGKILIQEDLADQDGNLIFTLDDFLSWIRPQRVYFGQYHYDPLTGATAPSKSMIINNPGAGGDIFQFELDTIGDENLIAYLEELDLQNNLTYSGAGEDPTGAIIWNSKRPNPNPNRPNAIPGTHYWIIIDVNSFVDPDDPSGLTHIVQLTVEQDVTSSEAQNKWPNDWWTDEVGHFGGEGWSYKLPYVQVFDHMCFL